MARYRSIWSRDLVPPRWRPAADRFGVVMSFVALVVWSYAFFANTWVLVSGGYGASRSGIVWSLVFGFLLYSEIRDIFRRRKIRWNPRDRARVS